MYEDLYRYLLHYKELSVPGVGTFLLERESAVVDFPNRLVHSPSYSFRLAEEKALRPSSFFVRLAAIMRTDAESAQAKFEQFARELRDLLVHGGMVTWKGVGKLQAGDAGTARLLPAPSVIQKPAPANKVIRENAEHFVRVGEDEKTSAEMTAYLAEPAATRTYWWAIALVIALLSVIFIGWYLSENGVDVNSIANTKKAELYEAEPAR